MALSEHITLDAHGSQIEACVESSVEFRPELRVEAVESIVEELAERGWSVMRDFFSLEQTRALYADAASLWSAGAFHAASIGKGALQVRRTEIRSDHVLWLERESASAVVEPYWAAMDELCRVVNQMLYLGAQTVEAHYAVYPSGALYKRHLDQHRGSPDRLISCVVYLNDDWREGDGGQLRIYDAAMPSGYTDVTPQGGTLVCFRSDTVEHEVLLAARERYSLTGWLRKNSVF